MWYPVVDMFTTKYYEAIIKLSKEIQALNKKAPIIKIG